MVITKEMLIKALRSGMTADDFRELMDAAIRDIDKEDIRRKALMDGMMAYVGLDHKLWNHMDPYDALDSVMYVLDELMAMDSPVANATKEKCSCGEDCSCNDKITAKMVVVDESGTHTRDLSADEIDDILDKWLFNLK